MSNRHLSRTLAMQALFQWDFLQKPEGQLASIVSFIRGEGTREFDDGGFMEELVQGVASHCKEIDESIAHFAPEWPLSSMTPIDRTILRLGTYELLFSHSIPARVAINESIELAKTFGGDASGRFINGVLGAIYKDLHDRGVIKEVDVEEKKEEKTPNSD